MTIISEKSFRGSYDKRAQSAVLVARAGMHRALLVNTLAILAFIGLGLLIASTALVYSGGFHWRFALFSVVAYCCSAALVLMKLGGYPHMRFGPANTITAIRAGITCVIGGSVIEAALLVEPAMAVWIWGFVLAAVVTLFLDGFDGYLARRLGTNSDFGARFDMEVDAVLILLLSIMVFVLGKASWWVILIGGMRYLFVAAQYFDNRLRGKLEPSLRRKTICVVQIVCLCITLAPIVQPPVSQLIAASALAALLYSFGRDIYMLITRTDDV